MRHIAPFLAAALLTAVLAPGALADGRNPGSALVYTVQRSGPGFFTVVSVTNTNLTPATPTSFGGSTLVHFEYANVIPNPVDPCLPLNCVIFDRVEFLTPADTLSVLTSCHNAVTPNGQQGYLVVSAQNPGQFDCPWTFDYLIGSSLVVNASGGMYGANALPFEAVVQTMPPMAAGPLCTDVDGEGDLDFDGIEYEPVADVLYGGFLAPAGAQLALINLTGGPTARNTLQFDIWNDNEFPLSTTKTFACWVDVPLSGISPLFSAGFLAGVPNDPAELQLACAGFDNAPGDGPLPTVETGWFRIESINVSTPGGETIALDGAVVGAITAGTGTVTDGGSLLWESTEQQCNGAFQDLQIDPLMCMAFYEEGEPGDGKVVEPEGPNDGACPCDDLKYEEMGEGGI